MFCCHCAKKIDEHKVEAKTSSYKNIENEISEDAKVQYVCPRCGHLIHDNISPDEVKSLSRAAHAELQRGRNAFAIGMGNISIAIISLAIAVIFFLLARDLLNQNKLDFQSAEFWVSMVLFIVSAVLLVSGVIYVSIGIFKDVRYKNLLKDINNKTFIQ